MVCCVELACQRSQSSQPAHSSTHAIATCILSVTILRWPCSPLPSLDILNYVIRLTLTVRLRLLFPLVIFLLLTPRS